MMFRLALLFCLILIGSTAALARNERPVDHYALALSWSPTYCASANGARDKTQCATGRRFAFVVHGLWPQYAQGWPEACETDERWVSEETISSLLDIMPSRGLIIHEWRKHGTCSGLGQAGYFALTRELFGKISIPARYLSPTDPVRVTPDQLIRDFIKTNRGLERDMISVHCGNRRDTARLSEVRVCFSTGGEPVSCPKAGGRRCRARDLILPPVK